MSITPKNLEPNFVPIGMELPKEQKGFEIDDTPVPNEKPVEEPDEGENWSDIVDDDGNKPADGSDVTADNNNWSEVVDDDTNKPDNNATVGAKSGTNLVDESDASLDDAAIKTEEGSALSTFESLTARENVTAGDGLGGVHEDQSQTTDVETNTMGRSSDSQKLAQSFQTALSNEKIFGVIIKIGKNGSPSDNCYVTIEGDNSGEPDGTPIATSQDVAGSGLSGTVTQEFIFSTPASLTASTTYWIVFQRDGALSDSDNYFLRIDGNNSTDNYTDGEFQEYTGADWTNETAWTYVDFVFTTFNTGDSFCWKSKADVEMVTDSFLGFAQATTTSGNTVKCQVNSVITKTGWGLTPLKEYYLTDTGGAIGLTPGTNTRKIGKAIAPTKLLMDRVTD